MPTERRELLAALGMLAVLPACATIGADAAGLKTAEDFAAGSEGTFYDARSGDRIGRRRLLKRILPAPIILLGEVHDNTVHHRIRAGLLLDWVRSRPERPAAVVFEHLDREYDDALRLAQKRRKGSAGAAKPAKPAKPAGAADSDEAAEDGGAVVTELLDAATFDRQAWGWPVHRPLFEAAQASGATWIAANFSRASARRLTRDPAAEVDPALQAMLESARWSDEAQRALSQALLQGHCGALPAAAVAGISRIQRLRDAGLALPLLDASERRSVLLAGNGHVRRDHGVPLYLGAYENGAQVIGFEEIPGKTSARTLVDLVGAERAQEFAGAYDFVCLTTTLRTGDPCANLKPLPAGPAPAEANGVSPAAPTQTPSR